MSALEKLKASDAWDERHNLPTCPKLNNPGLYGMDHSFFEGPPLLFETLVFGGPLDGEMKRYSSWEEAESGHEEILKRVKAEEGFKFI